jgi:hypothetical protein
VEVAICGVEFGCVPELEEDRDEDLQPASDSRASEQALRIATIPA